MHQSRHPTNELDKDTHFHGRLGLRIEILSSQTSMKNKRREDRLTLLVSLEPRAYSEVIGYTIGAMRPLLAVKVVEPDWLCSEVEITNPDIVLCSQPYCGCENGSGPYWLEYYPYAESPGENILVNGTSSGMADIEIDDLLKIVDRAEAYCS